MNPTPLRSDSAELQPGIAGNSDHPLADNTAAAEKRFQLLADYAPLLLWVTATDARCTFVNRKWLEFTGRRLEEELGDGWLDGVHPDDRRHCYQAYLGAFHARQPFTTEYRLRRQDGEYRWLQDSGAPYFEDSVFAGYIGSCVDITELKRAEADHRFTSELSAQLSLLSDPDAIEACVVQQLGLYLEVDGCVISAIDVDRNTSTVQHEWQRSGRRSMAGVYTLDQYITSGFFAEIQSGRTLVIDNSIADQRTHATSHRELEVGGLVSAPYLDRGHWVGTLSIMRSAPVPWRPSEIALVEAVAARAWPAIERARAEQARRASEEQRRKITDAMPGLISYVDADRRYRFVNATFERWFGMDQAQILGAHVSVVLGPEAYARIERYVDAALHGQRVTFENEITYVHGLRTILATYVPDFAPDGTVPGFYALITDITERKRTEQMLAEQARLLDLAHDAILVWELDGGIVYCNRSAEQLYGWTLEEMRGQTTHQLLRTQHTASLDEMLATLRATGSWVGQVVHATRAGEHLIVESRKVLLQNPGQAPRVLETTRDITARVQAELELTKSNETLERRVSERTAELEMTNRELARSNHDLDQFAYVASHDLKAPLRAIDHLATWIADDAAAVLPPPSKEHLAKLRSRVRRMEKLLDDLLVYSRAGRLQYAPEVVITGTLVADIFETLAPSATFRMSAQADLPTIITPRVPLELVLRNLIANAIKHHDRPDGCVFVGARMAANWVEFTVADDGPGIPPEFHDRVFRMFQTLQPRDKVEGSGIGLSIVKKVVESYGGMVYIVPNPGRGTRFHFTWPVAIEPPVTTQIP